MEKKRFEKLKEAYAKHYYHGKPSGTVIEEIVVRGENDTLIYWDGEKEIPIVDANSGCFGPVSIGYGNPEIAEAIAEQARKISHCLMISDTLLEFYEELESIVPEGFTRYYLTTSGSAANEIATRLAWKATGKRGIIGLHHGFHGFNMGSLSIGGALAEVSRAYIPMPPHNALVPSYNCYHCYFGEDQSYPECGLKCAHALERQIKYGGGEQAAAVIMEPIQGNGGHVFPPSKEYFKVIREICDQYGLLLIIDEVQTGTGRTGKWFASEHYEIDADIITVGKGFGGGVPIGVAIAKEEVLERAGTGPYFKQGDKPHILFSGTHSSDPLNAAAAVATIRYIKKHNLVERARIMGDKIRNELLEYRKTSSIVGRVEGKGLYIGVEVVKDKETREPFNAFGPFNQYARENGVFFAAGYGAEGNVIKIKPPLTMTDENIDKIIAVLKGGLGVMEEALGKGE